ncbi:MAG: hypothetical protein AB7S38_01985 [Vulcanimicrobiota bacterium]
MRLVFFLFLLSLLAWAEPPTERIKELEAKVAKSQHFDFELHNELRHLYGDVDQGRSLHHSDVILKNAPMHGYILDILAGWEKDPAKAVEKLSYWPRKYPRFRFVKAACYLRAGDLIKSSDPHRAAVFYHRVAGMQDEELADNRNLAQIRLQPPPRLSGPPWKVPVLEIRYFPLAADGQTLDLAVTSNVGDSLEVVRKKCDRLTRETAQALEEGSRFRAYKNPKAKPSLDYVIVDTLEVLEPVPHDPKKPGYSDYHKILERANIRDYVMKKGVKEVWIWGYHSPQLAPWESDLASVHGDISNSDRDPADLPILPRSYTVFHYNYQRETSEAVHDHIHQIEALMDHYGHDLWARFVGKPGAWRCGNCHFPPNGRHDYDWANQEYVQSDIEDWRPEGKGQMKRLNCDRWGGDSLRWFIYWMQSMPGAENGLVFGGKPLTNWWVYIGDYDAAVHHRVGLVGR